MEGCQAGRRPRVSHVGHLAPTLPGTRGVLQAPFPWTPRASLTRSCQGSPSRAPTSNHPTCFPNTSQSQTPGRAQRPPHAPHSSGPSGLSRPLYSAPQGGRGEEMCSEGRGPAGAAQALCTHPHPTFPFSSATSYLPPRRRQTAVSNAHAVTALPREKRRAGPSRVCPHTWQQDLYGHCEVGGAARCTSHQGGSKLRLRAGASFPARDPWGGGGQRELLLSPGKATIPFGPEQRGAGRLGTLLLRVKKTNPTNC